MVEISVSGVTGGRWKRARARIETPTSSETDTPRPPGTAPTRRPKLTLHVESGGLLAGTINPYESGIDRVTRIVATWPKMS